MSSLLDVAKTMNAEAGSSSAKLSLADVAKAEATASTSTKPLTLMDVAKQETQSSELRTTAQPTLQQLAEVIDKEDHSRIQAALETTAKEVKVELQELRTEVLKRSAAEVQREDQQAAQVLRANIVAVEPSKQESTKTVAAKAENDDGGYSSFEDDDDNDDCMKKDNNSGKQKQKEPVASSDDEGSEDEQEYEPPPRTTPSDSKESKEFLRAVYHADKYKVRDMLDDNVVDANIADQHGWSGLHWAASQNHGDMLKLLLQKGAEVNAVDQINGWTALHVAVVRESISCIKLLLSSGANPRIKDLYGDTVVECLQAASRKNKSKMLQLLHEHNSR